MDKIGEEFKILSKEIEGREFKNLDEFDTYMKLKRGEIILEF